MKIYLTTPLPSEGFARLSEHTFVTDLREAEVMISTFDYKVSREMIASAQKLRLITNFGVGYNNIDLEACRERGIRVTNTPQPVIEPTAELAFALMIAVARKTSLFDRQLREGTAEPFGVMNNLSHSLYGKKLGIIGMGNIGKALARRALASGMRVLYHNRHEIQPTGMPSGILSDAWVVSQAQYVSREELLREADFVSLNLPYTPEVHHLIGEKELKMMKPTAYLINTARGAHVCEADLVNALQLGLTEPTNPDGIAGAALDVYEFEPKIGEELLKLDNVVLSPHTGTGTWEGRIAMCENVADNILAFAQGETEKMNIVL